MNIALFTPNQNPYSETFIQAHKHSLKRRVFYYYGGLYDMKLEGHPPLTQTTKNGLLKIKRKVYRKPYSYIREELLLHSLKNNNTDIVLVEYGTHAQQLMPVLKKSGLPVVVHFHGYDASVESVIKNHNKYKEVFENASKIIAVSNVMVDRLKALGCPESKIIYNVYGPRPEFHLVEPTFSKKQFIAIGRFTDKKAPYYTILAFAEAVKQHPDARLVMAGDGALLNMCKNLARHLNIEKNLDFPGVVTAEEFREILKVSRAFVQHSITAANGDMEGTPLAVLEASAAGLPVISTKHAGIPDVIVDGKTGLLCDEHDVATMANHMDMLLSDVEKAKAMGAAGKVHIEKYFTLERHINELQKVLGDSLIS
ncbi:glycosyltransferase [uncultured Planktosalinus sp.]|mgnify:CR=1 FL=1|uniref:glycosyltransferase n=1 Tax=uncultured Planktosalinus sp. TaxID=1810935 RepID=UPI0030D98166